MLFGARVDTARLDEGGPEVAKLLGDPAINIQILHQEDPDTLYRDLIHAVLRGYLRSWSYGQIEYELGDVHPAPRLRLPEGKTPHDQQGPVSIWLIPMCASSPELAT
jgi:hypothetical protein